MLRRVYLGFAGACFAGYLGWSMMGLEFSAPADAKPSIRSTTAAARSTYRNSYYRTRSRGGYFGGGFGFGK